MRPILFIHSLALSLPVLSGCRDVDAEYSSRVLRRQLTVPVEQNGRTFRLDVHSLDGDDTTVKPGDVTDMGVVDESMISGFSVDSSDYCGTYETVRVGEGDEPPVPFGAASTVEYLADEDRIFHDPLADMLDEQIGQLRQVGVHGWTPEFCRRLTLIDPARCLVSVNAAASNFVDTTPLLLPPGLRFLHAFSVHSSYLEPDGPWNQINSLRYLKISGGPKLDATWISRQTDLLYLDGATNRYWSNMHTLSNLKNLRVLKLSWRTDITDIEFIRGMTELRELDIGGSGVTDLSPINALPNIRFVNADGAQIQRLPAGRVPSLRVLKLHSTNVSDDELIRFARTNPDCQIARRWHKTLADSVSNATRLRVVRRLQAPSDEGYSKTLFNVSDAEAIRRFVARLPIDEPQTSIHYLCTTSHLMEFYQEASFLASVEMICSADNIILRWQDVWPGDIKLSDRGAAVIQALFKEHGMQLADE